MIGNEKIKYTKHVNWFLMTEKVIVTILKAFPWGFKRKTLCSQWSQMVCNNDIYAMRLIKNNGMTSALDWPKTKIIQKILWNYVLNLQFIFI